MTTDIKQIARTLVDFSDGKDELEVRKAIKDVVQFLADQKMLGIWRELETAIHAVWKEKYGISSLKIISAHALSEEAEKKLREIGKGADIDLKVNDRLIGGAIMRIDDKRIDGSISGALRRLKTQIYG